MRIAVTTPTGHIGRKLVKQLLDEGKHELILLARQPQKLEEEQARGATVIAGDLTDADYVRRATQNVDALFWVNPPNYRTDDLMGYYVKLAENAASAIQANNIDKVVLVSSIGAHLGKGVGPVNALSKVEQIMRQTATNLTILRPTFFMENILGSMDGVIKAKSVFMPVDGAVRMSMIATQDVAMAAAKALTDTKTAGIKIMPLHGPKDYTFDEVANTIGKALGDKVNHVKVTPTQTREVMHSMGVSDHMCDLMLEMYHAMESGWMKDEFPRTKATTTRTTFDEFVRNEVVPVIPRKM